MRLGQILGTILLPLAGLLMACVGSDTPAPPQPQPPAAPVIRRFEASPSRITAGDPCRLLAEFEHGSGTIAPAVGAVTSGQGATVHPESSTRYTLTVRNEEGATALRDVDVEVLPRPRIESFTADPPAITDGQSVTILPRFSDGEGVVSPGLGPVASGVPLTVRPSGPATYTLTVTNPLGAQAVQELAVPVLPPPLIASLGASSTLLQEGQSTQILAIFADGTGTLEPGIGPVQSGVPVTVAPRATTRYTLSVANPLGATATRGLEITVDGQPAIASFSAEPPAITFGEGTRLTAVFSGGTGVLDHGIGTIASGIPIPVSPTATDKYTLRVTNLLGETVARELTVTVEHKPQILGFSANPATLTLGQSSVLTATFAHGTGRLEPGLGPVVSGQSVTVTPSATTIYTLVVTNPLGGTTRRDLTVTVVAPPVITGFTALPASITAGQNATLTPVFQNGTGRVEPGLGSVSSGAPLGVTPASTTTYTLTVTNAIGVTATRTATVTVVPAPAISAFSAAPAALTQGASSTLAFTFTGGSGVIEPGIGPVTSGIDAVVSPAVDTIYTLTVTNALGFAVSQSVPVAVYGSPSITSFAALPDLLTLGESTQLTGVFSGGTGTVDGGVGPLASGVSVSASPATTTTYTLTVANPLGVSATRTATVTVVPPPVITGFSASTLSLTLGGSALLTATFSGGTGVIAPGIGAATSGTPLSVTPTTTTIYTLTVTNPAGATATQSLTITVLGAPAIASFTANTDPISAGSGAWLTAVYTDGTGAIDQGVGPAPSGVAVFVQPASTTTYQLTVTNPLGASVTRTLTVNVVPPPVITSFTATPPGVIQGVSTELLAVFANGTGSITPGVGPVASGTGIPLTPATSTIYTLTVTNPAGSSVTRVLEVVVTPFGLSLLAGNLAGEGYTDGTGGAGRFRLPTGAAVDVAGNLYVADSWNHTIRQITIAGIATTIAGSPGQEGSTDGPAALARFRNPVGLAFDGSGNLYVADAGNHTIRKLDLGGIVSTFAGSAGLPGSSDGTGAAARFLAPEGIAVSGATLVVTDTGNHTVRTLDASANVTTLAGSAGIPGSADGSGIAAQFREPSGIVADGAGNLYLADRGNHTLRRIDATAAVITLAGSPGESGATNGNGALARFNLPDGLARSSMGEIYIADSGNHSVRWLSTGGTVNTLVGTSGEPGWADGGGAVSRFRGPRGLALTATGNLMVADSGNHAVRRIVPGPSVSTPAGSPPLIGSANAAGSSARFNEPRGLSANAEGEILLADGGNHSIRKVTPQGTASLFAGLSGTPGALDGTGVAARFRGPSGTCTDGAGNLYVADTDNHLIRKVTPGGVVTTVAGSGSPGSLDANGALAQFNAPRGLEVDAIGNLYVADTGNHTIRLVTPAGDVITLAGLAGAPGSTDASGGLARFRGPEEVALDALGNLYVADTGNHTIRKITPGGLVTTLAGSAGVPGLADGNGAAARFCAPAGIDADVGGILFVADTGNHTLRRISLTGDVTTLAGTPTLGQVITGSLPGGLVSPTSILVHPHGHLVVTTSHGLVRVAGW